MANATTVAFGPQLAGIGNKHVLAVELSIDTYASGGIAVAVPASITKPVVLVSVSGGYTGEWDATNSKVILYASAGTEATTLSSAVKVTVLFIGQ